MKPESVDKTRVKRKNLLRPQIVGHHHLEPGNIILEGSWLPGMCCLRQLWVRKTRELSKRYHDAPAAAPSGLAARYISFLRDSKKVNLVLTRSLCRIEAWQHNLNLPATRRSFFVPRSQPPQGRLETQVWKSLHPPLVVFSRHKCLPSSHNDPILLHPSRTQTPLRKIQGIHHWLPEGSYTQTLLGPTFLWRPWQPAWTLDLAQRPHQGSHGNPTAFPSASHSEAPCSDSSAQCVGQISPDPWVGFLFHQRPTPPAPFSPLRLPSSQRSRGLWPYTSRAAPARISTYHLHAPSVVSSAMDLSPPTHEGRGASPSLRKEVQHLALPPEGLKHPPRIRSPPPSLHLILRREESICTILFRKALILKPRRQSSLGEANCCSPIRKS